jgi:hypothetical protein
MKADNIEAGELPDLTALEIVADWKDDLQIRLDRERLLYELVSTDNRERVIALGAEVDAYKRLIAVMKRLAVIQ